MKDSVRTRGTGPFLAARCRGVRRRSGRGVCATGRSRTAWAFHGSALNDSDAELILAHIDHPDGVIGNRAVNFGRMFQHSLDVVIGDVNAIFGSLGQGDYRA